MLYIYAKTPIPIAGFKKVRTFAVQLRNSSPLESPDALRLKIGY